MLFFYFFFHSTSLIHCNTSFLRCDGMRRDELDQVPGENNLFLLIPLWLHLSKNVFQIVERKITLEQTAVSIFVNFCWQLFVFYTILRILELCQFYWKPQNQSITWILYIVPIRSFALKVKMMTFLELMLKISFKNLYWFQRYGRIE